MQARQIESDLLDSKNHAVWAALAKNRVDRERLLASLAGHLDEPPFNQTDLFSDCAVAVSKQALQDASRLCHVLNHALEQVVNHYVNDARIRLAFNLDKELDAIVRLAADHPYSVGMFRPDLVYDDQGQAKICEIGCRYPINGWMISHYISQAVSHRDAPTIATRDRGPNAADWMADLVQALRSEHAVFWVHQTEPGTEINYLINELSHYGIDVISVSPDELQEKSGSVYAKGLTADRFILECDREELKQIDHSVLSAMVRTGVCVNDVRSLILVHDKKILSILYDQNIMNDYLSAPDYQFLKRFLIPSFTLDHPRTRSTIIGSNDNWILKRSSGGRGVGMVVKNECSQRQWETLVNQQHENYMVQRYIDQQVFRFEHQNEELSAHLVGMMLCINARSYGFGIFRGSSESIINLHQGRGVIMPCVFTDQNGDIVA